MKVLKDDEEVVITGKELAKHRDICRKEGAITELESLHKLINNDLNYGHLLIRKQINDLIKKRLKELESKGVN